MEHPTDRDAKSEADLFREMYPRLRRFAAAIGPEEVEPDDLVQEAVERTLRSHRLTELDNPFAYLTRTIVNLASNQRRGFARSRRAANRMHIDEAVPTAYPSDLEDLLRLPAKQRAMLYLREVEGLSYAEVGEQMAMDERAVARATQRARKRLGAELREEMA